MLGICDAGNWLKDQVDAIVSGFLKDLVSDATSAVASFFESLNFITRTPQELSYQQDYVVRFEGAMRACPTVCWASSAWSPASTCCGGPPSACRCPAPSQILPRLILGAILITTAHDWTRLAIDVNNAACDLVVGGTLPSTLTELAWSSMEPMLLLAFLVRAVLLVLLVLQLLMRLALVDILLVLAPLAAVLWILPQTQGWASLWAQRFVSTVFAQFVQMLALSLGSGPADQAADQRRGGTHPAAARHRRAGRRAEDPRIDGRRAGRWQRGRHRRRCGDGRRGRDGHQGPGRDSPAWRGRSSRSRFVDWISRADSGSESWADASGGAVGRGAAPATMPLSLA